MFSFWFLIILISRAASRRVQVAMTTVMGFVGHLIFSVCYFTICYPFSVLFSKRKKSLSSLEGISEILQKGPIAHRGGIPENTIKAFRNSKSRGASGIEVDLQFTKDGHPVLLHDDTVDRTSNGTGSIRSLTLEEARALDMGSKFGYSGVQIPTLEETINVIKELDIVLFLEVKALNQNTIPILLEMFRRDSSLYNRVVVISFFPDVIYKISELDPKIKIGYTTRSTLFSRLANGSPRFKWYWVLKTAELLEDLMYWMINRFVLPVLDPPLMLPHKDDILLKRFDLEKHRKNRVILLPWTVNREDEKQHFTEVLQIPFMTDIIKN